MLLVAHSRHLAASQTTSRMNPFIPRRHCIPTEALSSRQGMPFLTLLLYPEPLMLTLCIAHRSFLDPFQDSYSQAVSATTRHWWHTPLYSTNNVDHRISFSTCHDILFTPHFLSWTQVGSSLHRRIHHFTATLSAF